jgi:hypothetical protein
MKKLLKQFEDMDYVEDRVPFLVQHILPLEKKMMDNYLDMNVASHRRLAKIILEKKEEFLLNSILHVEFPHSIAELHCVRNKALYLLNMKGCGPPIILPGYD